MLAIRGILTGNVAQDRLYGLHPLFMMTVSLLGYYTAAYEQSVRGLIGVVIK